MTIVRRDSLDMLFRAHEFASSADVEDDAAARAFALREGIEASRRDLAWHARAQQLWDLLNVVGVHRAGAQPTRAPARPLAESPRQIRVS